MIIRYFLFFILGFLLGETLNLHFIMGILERFGG